MYTSNKKKFSPPSFFCRSKAVSCIASAVVFPSLNVVCDVSATSTHDATRELLKHVVQNEWMTSDPAIATPEELAVTKSRCPLGSKNLEAVKVFPLGNSTDYVWEEVSLDIWDEKYNEYFVSWPLDGTKCATNMEKANDRANCKRAARHIKSVGEAGVQYFCDQKFTLKVVDEFAMQKTKYYEGEADDMSALNRAVLIGSGVVLLIFGCYVCFLGRSRSTDSEDMSKSFGLRAKTEFKKEIAAVSKKLGAIKSKAKATAMTVSTKLGIKKDRKSARNSRKKKNSRNVAPEDEDSTGLPNLPKIDITEDTKVEVVESQTGGKRLSIGDVEGLDEIEE